MASKKSVTATFTKAKETKGTWAFTEDGEPENHISGSLYIKKSRIAELGEPTQITVTVSA